MSFTATISFKPRPDDYAAVYALALSRQTRSYRAWIRFGLCVASWAATLVSLSTANAITGTSVLTGAFCSAAMIYIFTAKMFPNPETTARQKYAHSKTPEAFRQITVTLDETGVRLLKPNSKYWFSWSLVDRVIITEQHLFIVVSSSSATMFIPVRAFDSNDSFLAFARIAQSQYAPAESSQPAGGFEVILKEQSGS